MPRVKIQVPEEFNFSCSILIRITDINYGGHAGNDTVLSIIHEARMQYLKSMGYTEMEFGGVGMIMADVAIEFKSEMFYGDIIQASVTCGEITKVGFELFYKLEINRENKTTLAVVARTGMVCYDYNKKKITAVPDCARRNLHSISSNFPPPATPASPTHS